MGPQRALLWYRVGWSGKGGRRAEGGRGTEAYQPWKKLEKVGRPAAKKHSSEGEGGSQLRLSHGGRGDHPRVWNFVKPGNFGDGG